MSSTSYLARNALWQTAELAELLAQARVIICGMGGLGWIIGGALVGLGVRRLVVFDPDRLDVTNLNRLWGLGQGDIGTPKVDLFARHARAVEPAIEVEAHALKIPGTELEIALESADVLFGAFDASEPRVEVQVLARMHRRLYIDAGVGFPEGRGARAAFGQVFVDAGVGAGCIVCAGLRLSAPGYLRGEDRRPLPSSGFLNGIVGNMAVCAWLDRLERPLSPPGDGALGHKRPGASLSTVTYFRFDGQATRTRRIAQSSSCGLCSSHPESPDYFRLTMERTDAEPPLR